eukprot:2116931-Rhodomonas_salina.3
MALPVGSPTVSVPERHGATYCRVSTTRRLGCYSKYLGMIRDARSLRALPLVLPPGTAVNCVSTAHDIPSP